MNKSFFRSSFISVAKGTAPVIWNPKDNMGKAQLVSISGEEGKVKAVLTAWHRVEKVDGKRPLSSTMAKIGIEDNSVLKKLIGRVGDAKPEDTIPVVPEDSIAIRLNVHQLCTFKDGWLMGISQDDGYSQSFVTWMVMKKALIVEANKVYGFDVIASGTYLHLWGVQEGKVAGTLEFSTRADLVNDGRIGMKATAKKVGREEVSKPEGVTTQKAADLISGKVFTL